MLKQPNLAQLQRFGARRPEVAPAGTDNSYRPFQRGERIYYPGMDAVLLVLQNNGDGYGTVQYLDGRGKTSLFLFSNGSTITVRR